MQNFLKKIPILVSIVLFILLSLGLFFLYREINLNNQKAELSIMELENEAKERSEIKLLNNSIGTIKENRALLQTHFAQSSDIVPFLDTIERLAQKVGTRAEITTVDILKDNATGLVVTMNVSGNFENIYKFLKLLENSSYELEVDRADLKQEVSSSTAADGTLVQSSGWQAIFKVKLLSFIQ